MARVALYARVSTTDQHPEIQLNSLRTYAEARSLKVAEVYVDVGASGAKSKRPALDRLWRREPGWATTGEPELPPPWCSQGKSPGAHSTPREPLQSASSPSQSS